MKFKVICCISAFSIKIMLKVAVLDDYQNVTKKFGNWEVLKDKIQNSLPTFPRPSQVQGYMYNHPILFNEVKSKCSE